MTASTITDMRVSEFLLAFFEGTGWYTPDYKMAEPMFWGKGQGCDFLDTPCLDSNGETSFPDFFCTNTGEDGCSYTNGGYAICGTNDMSVTDSSLNSNFDYFGGNVVMRDRFADNCPYYVNYLDGNCGDESNEDINLEGSEYFGSKSSCFTGTLGENKAKSQKSSYCFKKTVSSFGLTSEELNLFSVNLSDMENIKCKSQLEKKQSLVTKKAPSLFQVYFF